MTQPASGPYLTIAVLAIAAAGFAVAPLGLAWLWAKKFSPQKPGLYKNATYECGLESKSDALIQFRAGVLPLRNHLSYLRCGSDLSAAVRGGVYRTDGWRVHCNAGVFAAAG